MDELNASDRQTRLKAVRALHAAESAASVSELISALGDLDTHVRKLAALALGDRGPAARSAIPALIEALRDEDAGVRRRAAVALGELQASAATSALESARTDSAETVRRAAKGALEELAQLPVKKAA